MMGKIVIVKGVISNGHDDQPGIITQPWGHSVAADGPLGSGAVQVCNVKVFPDCGIPFDATSVKIFSEETTALHCDDKVFGWTLP